MKNVIWKLGTLITLIAGSYSLFAQDTVVMMQYNLLYYHVNPGFCNQTNNNVDAKAEQLKKTINYIKPDIFAVNELGSTQEAVNHVLNNALNVDGVTHYAAAEIENQVGSNIMNMLFYNQDKFNLKSQTSVVTEVRDINIYTLEYTNTPEPVEIHCAVAHLKAGSSTSDRAKRAEMTAALMEYLQTHPNTKNFMFSGDFNTRKSSEQSLQNLLNPQGDAIIFVDPADAIGDWYNKYAMRMHHTQATRKQNVGCYASGGMDDRFDFIMTSDDVLTSENNFQYIEDSYFAVGQDGNRFDESLIVPENTSAPAEVINALYNTSDHLPVVAKFVVGDLSTISQTRTIPNLEIQTINSDGNTIHLKFITDSRHKLNLDLNNVLGQTIYSDSIEINGTSEIRIPCDESGMFLLQLSDINNNTLNKKIYN